MPLPHLMPRWRTVVLILLTFWLPVHHAHALEMVDAREKTIRFAKPPQRIVSLVPAVTEILVEIGAGDRVVGITSHDIVPQAAGKKVVGGFFSPSLDRILALNPDIVFVSSLHNRIIQGCEARDIPVLQLDLGTLPKSLKTMQDLGRLFRREAAAEALQKKITAQFDLIARKMDAVPKSRRLRTVRFMGRERILSPGDDSFQNQLIKAAGGIAPVWGKNGPVVEISVEAWRQFNPQVIYGCGGDRETARRFFSRPGWKDVDAVRTGRIYYFPCELTCRAGAHTGDFAAWLWARLYGERFSDPKRVAAQNRILSRQPLGLELPYVKHAEVVHSRIYDFTHKSMLITFASPMTVVSTLEGTRQGVTAAGNHYFPPPCWYLGHGRGLEGLRTTVCGVLDLEPKSTALLFTGADMDHLSIQRQRFRDITVYALVTAGARSNALRAAKDEGRYYEPGTINIVLMTNMALTSRAMNRAVISATEAKSAALQDLDIRSSYSPKIHGATGTGTDNIVVVQGAGTAIDNSGGHTKMGELISKAVYQGVREALLRQNGFASGRNVLQRLNERKISIRQLFRQDDCPCGLKPHELAAAMETLLLEPRYASFMEAAFAVSDDYEQGLVSSLEAFESWSSSTARQIAGGPIADYGEIIDGPDLPVVLYQALNALANGVKSRHERQSSEQ